MSKIKVENSIFTIIFETIRIYCANFWQFAKYMWFPVLGQFIGLFWIFGLANFYKQNLPLLMEEFPVFNSPTTSLICVLIIVIPGMIVFLKAFWDYLVAYGALSSMTDSAITTGKVYDFPAHNSVITQRTFSYVALWFLYGIFLTLAICPLLWVIAGILFVYFILIFQVFTFEPDVSAIGCFKISLELIKGNFLKTFLIMTILGLFTHVLFVQGFSVFIDLTHLTDVFVGFFEGIITQIPLDPLNDWLIQVNPRSEILTPLGISRYCVSIFIVAPLVIYSTLPIRAIAWTLWYKALNTANKAQAENKKSKSAKKKLDKEIIDRANKKGNL